MRNDFNLMISPDAKVRVGRNTFFNNHCSLNALCSISIGDNCLFGEGVRIYDHNHRFSKVGLPFVLQGFKSGDVQIGSNCWIGSNVLILKGAVIGDNCVIGAGSIVSGSIPPSSLVKPTVQLNISKISFAD